MAVTLGIDIGTTKCAVVCFDTDDRKLLVSSSRNHDASLPTEPDYSEQDPRKLLSCVFDLITALPEEERQKISAIGVTGQMHSVMGWNKTDIFPLITWQDRRCSLDGSLQEFRRKSGYDLHEGYGAATLAWLGTQTASWEYASTIMDYLTFLLCGNKKPVTDASNAASWGIFDFKKNQWDFTAAESLGIPERLLPKIRETGAVIGNLTVELSQRLGLPEGVPVINAIGDNQASVFGTGKDFETELFLTLGTGAQLSAVISESEFQTLSPCGKLEIRPFDRSRKLAVCSALCGGKAFSWIGEMVCSILKDLDLPEPEFPELLDRIDSLALQSFSRKNGVKMIPSFLGERNDPNLRGTITGLTLDNFSLGSLGAAAADGILENLISDFPSGLLEKRTHLLGSGNGIRKVNTIQKMIEEKFTQKFILTTTREEACCGAAILASKKGL